ncbi:peroxisome biogenesis protein 5 [Cyclospora cayetanensis]|uniref:Peroxisome biogenesis protein 5 n=1 Tax=Cyclospora cayetanensis TaxID=88456 RepID=A0A6P6S4C3_9EIME|nr:peroxisome biogenesis protein 5 [Cyclospora cayetanensis]
MAFRALLSHQQPQGCNAPSGPPAVSGSRSNPLTSFLTAATEDPLRTQQLTEGYNLAALQGPLGAPLEEPFIVSQQEKGFLPPFTGAVVGEHHVSPIERAVAEAVTTRAAPHATTSYGRGIDGLLAGGGAAAEAAAAAEASAEAELLRVSHYKRPVPPPAAAEAAAGQRMQPHQRHLPDVWAAEFMSRLQRQPPQPRQMVQHFGNDSGGLVQEWANEFSLLSLGGAPEAEHQQHQQHQQQQQQQQQQGPPPRFAGAFEASQRLLGPGGPAAWGQMSVQQFPLQMFFPQPQQQSQQQSQQQQQQQSQQQQEQEDGGLAQAEEQEPQAPEVFDPTVARDLVRGLKAVGGPKLLNAEFTRFVEALADGGIRLENGQLLTNEGRKADWDEILASEEAKKMVGASFETEDAFDEAPEAATDFDKSLRELEETWKKAHANGEIDDEELGLFQSIFNSKDMTEILQKDTPEQMGTSWITLQQGALAVAPPVYFRKENPYLKTAGGLECAQRLLAEGKLQEAILALEAEVQRHPNSSEGWRLLGECHADNEQDIEAIHCLKRGHGVDPYNLDSLMALGVSLTNELDVSQALLYLRTWLANHDDFQGLPGLSERPPDDFQLLKSEVASLFEAALRQPQGSAGRLHSALGVLYNIDRHYDKALYHLSEALKYAKNDVAASLWNKIGATLANSGRSAAALIAYQQTLSLRPNYPRAWTNLGVAKANLGEMEQALQHYLVALELNPEATHLWYYIRSALISLNRYDWISFTENRDFQGLRKVVPRGDAPPLSALIAPGDPRAAENSPKVLEHIFSLIR